VSLLTVYKHSCKTSDGDKLLVYYEATSNNISSNIVDFLRSNGFKVKKSKGSPHFGVGWFCKDILPEKLLFTNLEK